MLFPCRLTVQLTRATKRLHHTCTCVSNSRRLPPCCQSGFQHRIPHTSLLGKPLRLPTRWRPSNNHTTSTSPVTDTAGGPDTCEICLPIHFSCKSDVICFVYGFRDLTLDATLARPKPTLCPPCFSLSHSSHLSYISIHHTSNRSNTFRPIIRHIDSILSRPSTLHSWPGLHRSTAK
jgi:hypothetical protein